MAAMSPHCLPLRLPINPLGPQFTCPAASTRLRIDEVLKPEQILDERLRTDLADLGVEVAAVVLSQRAPKNKGVVRTDVVGRNGKWENVPCRLVWDLSGTLSFIGWYDTKALPPVPPPKAPDASKFHPCDEIRYGARIDANISQGDVDVLEWTELVGPVLVRTDVPYSIVVADEVNRAWWMSLCFHASLGTWEEALRRFEPWRRTTEAPSTFHRPLGARPGGAPSSSAPLPPPVLQLTKRNHFVFGFDGGHFNRPEARPARYATSYGKPARKPKNFRAELQHALRDIVDTYGKIAISNSGTALGTVLLHEAKALGLPFKAVTVELEGHGTPPVDDTLPGERHRVSWDEFTQFATSFAEQAGGSNGWTALEALHGQLGGGPHVYTHDRIGFVRPLAWEAGPPGPLLWTSWEDERVSAIARWLLASRKTGVAQFLHWSPELMAALVTGDTWKQRMREASEFPPALRPTEVAMNTYAVLRAWYPSLELFPTVEAARGDAALGRKMRALSLTLMPENVGGRSVHQQLLPEFLTSLDLPRDLYEVPPTPATPDEAELAPSVRGAALRTPRAIDSIETIDFKDVYPYLREARWWKWCVVRVRNAVDDFEAVQRFAREVEQRREFVAKDIKTNEGLYNGISIQTSDNVEDKLYGSVTTHLKTAYAKLPDGRQLKKLDHFQWELGGKVIDLAGLRAAGIDPSKLDAPAPEGLYLRLADWASMLRPFIRKWAERGIVLERGRLLRTLPGLRPFVHNDSDVRLHVPIYTHTGCVARFYDKQKENMLAAVHLPADGAAYLFNAYPMHEFENVGETPRLHMTFALWTYFSPDWKSENLRSFADMLRQVQG
jgi:hypothetical protein